MDVNSFKAVGAIVRNQLTDGRKDAAPHRRGIPFLSAISLESTLLLAVHKVGRHYVRLIHGLVIANGRFRALPAYADALFLFAEIVLNQLLVAGLLGLNLHAGVGDFRDQCLQRLNLRGILLPVARSLYRSPSFSHSGISSSSS